MACSTNQTATGNRTTGFFEIVPAADLVPLTLSVEDAFKMIISGGLVPPKILTRQPDPDPIIP